jgi:hypothetical protein
VLSVLAAMALASACTTVRAPRAEPETTSARDRGECEQEALSGFDSARARLVIRHAATGMLAWSLLGAAHGAYSGALWHGDAGTAAWIGAAAGAGVGLAIGLVEGWSGARAVRASYRDAVNACLAGGPVSRGGAEAPAVGYR